MRWRQFARTASLIVIGAAGAYLLVTVLVSRAALLVVDASRQIKTPFIRLALGVAVVDLSKLLGLLPAAWLLRNQLQIRPTVAASALVVLCFAVEALVASLVQAGGWLWAGPIVLIARLIAAAVLVYVVTLVLSRRRSI